MKTIDYAIGYRHSFLDVAFISGLPQPLKGSISEVHELCNWDLFYAST